MFKIRVLESNLKKMPEGKGKNDVLKKQLADFFIGKFSNLLNNITFNVVNTYGRGWDSPVYIKDIQNPNVIHFYIGCVCADGPVIQTELDNISHIKYTNINEKLGTRYSRNTTLPTREDIVYFSEYKHCYAIGRTVFLIKEVIPNLEIDAILEYIKDPIKYKRNLNYGLLLKALKVNFFSHVAE